MDYSGTFPFGWIRNLDNDNWQLVWNKNSGDFFVKSIKGKEIRLLESFSNWKDAKEYADKLINDPTLLN